jgi:hypothetical protein
MDGTKYHRIEPNPKSQILHVFTHMGNLDQSKMMMMMMILGHEHKRGMSEGESLGGWKRKERVLGVNMIKVCTYIYIHIYIYLHYTII